MIKKLFIMLILISNFIFLAGCWDSEEVDKMEIISGVAIDKGKDGYKYNLAVEVIGLEKGGSEGSNKSEQTSKIVEASADTLFEATRKIISTTSRKMYYGHCKTVIISKDIARDGIIPILDIFMRLFSSSITIDILVSKDIDAIEVFKQTSIRTSPNGFEIETLLKNDQKYLSYSKKMELYEVINELGTQGINLTLPVITVEKKDEKSVFKLDGIAVFSKDELVGFIEGDKTKYFLLIRGLIKGGPITIEVDKKDKLYDSVRLNKNKSSMDYSQTNNNLTISINTTSEVNITEIGSTNKFSDENHNKLKLLLESKLEKNMKNLITEVQETGCDIFGFGKTIYKNNPDLWETYKKDWKKIFKNLNIKIKSNIQIHNEGSITKEIQSEE